MYIIKRSQEKNGIFREAAQRRPGMGKEKAFMGLRVLKSRGRTACFFPGKGIFRFLGEKTNGSADTKRANLFIFKDSGRMQGWLEEYKRGL